MERKSLNLAELSVETFDVAPGEWATDWYSSSDWCDTDRECSSHCLAATNVCRVCG
ncbi:MAG TPA: hypothetical protein VFR81_19550 [Longimicrobium sp.]|nr:hypothetical protein [Longimicrobium sp.]